MPVNTMAMPAASAAATTSSSRIDPPGWITQVAPAAADSINPSAKGKNASDATAYPMVKGAGRPIASAIRSAFLAAISAESSRDIWPAPTPTVAPSLT